MHFSSIKWGSQSSRRTNALPFERQFRVPQIPLSVPVSSDALKTRRRRNKANRKLAKLTKKRARRNQRLGRKRLSQSHSTSNNNEKRGKSKETVDTTIANTVTNCYDTKRSPIAKAKRKPRNHSFWGDIEHRFTIPSELILKQAKRDQVKAKMSPPHRNKSSAHSAKANANGVNDEPRIAAAEEKSDDNTEDDYDSYGDDDDEFDEESNESESVPGNTTQDPREMAEEPPRPLKESASASEPHRLSNEISYPSHTFLNKNESSASTPALTTGAASLRLHREIQPFRNRFGQLVLPKPVRGYHPDKNVASDRKRASVKRRPKRRKRRPQSAMPSSPGRGMQRPQDGPGAGAYQDLDTFGSQSIILRNSRPTSASFAKSNRFSLLGSGDPNAYRGIGIPGPGRYKPVIPRAIKALNPLVEKPVREEVLSQDRFDGTNCTWTGTGFYYCSRSDMERREFPGPGSYRIKDEYLSTNTAATGGGRFNESKPLSFVDIITNRACKIPGPNLYKVNDSENAIRPNKCSVVGFGPDLHRDTNRNALKREEFMVAFDYDPKAVTPAPWQYDVKEGVVTYTKM